MLLAPALVPGFGPASPRLHLLATKWTALEQTINSSLTSDDTDTRTCPHAVLLLQVFQWHQGPGRQAREMQILEWRSDLRQGRQAKQQLSSPQCLTVHLHGFSAALQQGRAAARIGQASDLLNISSSLAHLSNGTCECRRLKDGMLP